MNALGQEGAFVNLVMHAGFQNPHLCKVNIPITGSLDQMKQMSLRGLLSTALAAEQQRRSVMLSMMHADVQLEMAKGDCSYMQAA